MNLPKYIIVLVVAFVATINTTIAQNYSITPSDTIQLSGVLEDLQTLSIHQLNISNDTLLLKWKKISVSIPALWDANVCDNFSCNTSLADSGTMNPVIPTDYGLLVVHITPHVNYGTAIIRYAVWDVNFPSQKDTLTYLLTCNATTGINDQKQNTSWNVFPNPSAKELTISSNFQSGFNYSITDAAGKIIYTGFSKSAFIIISISNFVNGIYTVSMIDEMKNICSKRIIVQH